MAARGRRLPLSAPHRSGRIRSRTSLRRILPSIERGVSSI